ncbi:MAG: PDZ domain-containing protein [Ignavibacteria bacterium]|nr:PDZ domain-containing protein [Ignavibacteria bacterium]
MKNLINYRISFSDAIDHYCDVIIEVNCVPDEPVFFSMPVWTPGSYLVRDYAGKIHNVSASSSGVSKRIEKISKNTWRVEPGNSDSITFAYRVYCNELTVRTSEVNESHAFLNSSGVFMFVRGRQHLPCALSVELPKSWHKISTGLEKAGSNRFSAANYDEFIDCPLEIGNHNVLEFNIRNIPHRICITGTGNYDSGQLVSDFRKIAETQIRFFGNTIPYKHYTYIVHLVEKGGGGLEHLNSFVVQFPRLNFTDAKAYRKFLGLVSHEYFHLWNVKRIRPVALGPFDYDKENYTQSLWIAEGWTSYYDNVFLVRAGLISPEEYLEMLGHEYNDIMRFTGRFRQALRESSFDTWIKFYKKDENSNNTQISYYTKGALVAALLNIEIMTSTDCRKSLDDVMKQLYKDYLENPAVGYTEDRVKEIAESVCGKNLNAFWKKYLDGTDEIPIRQYLSKCGIAVKDVNEHASCSLDAETKSENGRLLITKLFEGGSGYSAGLSSGDEIIAIDGYRVDEELMKKILSGKKKGDEINVLTARKGMTKLIKVILKAPLPKFSLSLKPALSPKESKLLDKWLRG